MNLFPVCQCFITNRFRYPLNEKDDIFNFVSVALLSYNSISFLILVLEMSEGHLNVCTKPLSMLCGNTNLLFTEDYMQHLMHYIFCILRMH